MKNIRRFNAKITSLHPSVTGSCILVTVSYPDGKEDKFIIDCGLFQNNDDMLNDYIPFDPLEYKFSVNTHVHVDHIGRYPLLVQHGFKGKIYTTYYSLEFCNNVLNDVAHTLEKNSMENSIPPLFTSIDVNNCLKQFVGVPYRKIIKPTKNISIILYENGHIFGACIVYVVISYPGEQDIILLFTGDYNNKNLFFSVPELPLEVTQNYVSCAIVESTYGNIDSTDIALQPYLETFITDAISNNHTIYLPTFALGRNQEVLYYLKCFQDKSILSKDIPIYIDGYLPKQYIRMLQYSNLGLFPHMRNFLPANLSYVFRNSRYSLALDKKPKIVVAPGGDSEHGAITTYMKYGIDRDDCSVFYSGFVSENSAGGKLKSLKYNEVINYHGRQLVKRCTVGSSGELSAHIKADEFIEELSKFQNIRTYLTNHGSSCAQESFKNRLRQTFTSSTVESLTPNKCFVIFHNGIQDII